MSGLFTIRRTKGGRTHYVASVIPKTAVIEGFTDDPAKALKFKEDDAKALWEAIKGDTKVYGRWAVLDSAEREVSVFTHATPEPKKPRELNAKSTGYIDIPAGMNVTTGPVTDRLLADEPDHSPFRELAEVILTGDTPWNDATLGELATAAAKEIKALRESLDDLDALTAPPADDDTVLVDDAK